MIKINLKKFVAKKEIAVILDKMVDLLDDFVAILDIDGNTLVSGRGDEELAKSFPIIPGSEVIGWVKGGDKSSVIATILTYQTYSEIENKELARETLYRYKELVLLHNTVEKISSNLVLNKVGQFIIEEARKLIIADNVSVMLMNNETGILDIIAAIGTENKNKVVMHKGEGIAGNIFSSGKTEIINNVSSDQRSIKGEGYIYAMMCAPLKSKDNVLGVINISSADMIAYTSEDLKLFNTLALHGAIAIENAKYTEELTRHRDNLEELVSERTKELEKKNEILQKHLDEIKILRGLLPICANCRKIRDDSGYWEEMEVYFHNNSAVEFSHGLCPGCVKELYPDCAEKILNRCRDK